MKLIGRSLFLVLPLAVTSVRVRAVGPDSNWLAPPPTSEHRLNVLTPGNGTAAAPPTTGQFAAISDRYLRRGSPDKNQGAQVILRVRKFGKNRVLVAFDGESVAVEQTVNEQARSPACVRLRRRCYPGRSLGGTLAPRVVTREPLGDTTR